MAHLKYFDDLFKYKWFSLYFILCILYIYAYVYPVEYIFSYDKDENIDYYHTRRLSPVTSQSIAIQS